jgi:hypothetical protein
MHIHPYLGSELTREKQRDMIGPTQWAPAHRTRDLTRVSRGTTWAKRLLLRCVKRNRTAALGPEVVPTRSELETTTVTSSR